MGIQNEKARGENRRAFSVPTLVSWWFARDRCYFLRISLPQQLRGTVQQPSAAELQAHVLATSNSRPHASHTNTLPSFMSQQFAIITPSLICNNHLLIYALKTVFLIPVNCFRPHCPTKTFFQKVRE
jgi:hypothetical protein